MNDIRHILMDLDGSVIDEYGSACPVLLKMIQSTPEIDWIIVTSRSFMSAASTPIARCLSRAGLHVFDGGATVASFDGQYVDRRILRKRELRLARRHVAIDNAAYIYASTTIERGLVWCSTEEIKIQAAESTTSIELFWDTVLRSAVTKLTVRQQPPFQPLRRIWHTRNQGHFDITRRGISKASGVLRVFKERQYDPGRSLFIFNDRNDLPVVKHPSLKSVLHLKVGGDLPAIPSHFHAPSVRDVTSVLLQLGIANAVTEVRPTAVRILEPVLR